MAKTPLRAALGLFGFAMQRAAAAGRATWSVVTGTRDAIFRSQGTIQLPPTDAIDAVMGWANSRQAAIDAFNAAPPGTPVDSTMVTSRYVNNSFEAFNASPTYSIHTEFKLVGDPQTYAVTLSGINPVGMTVDQLRSIAELNVIGVATSTGPQAGQQVTLEAVTGIAVIANTTRLAGL